MTDQSSKGKNARRLRQGQPSPAPSQEATPTPAQEPTPQPRPTPVPPPEVKERPEQARATESDMLRDQPIVAYALVFALLALLLICALSIYMATH